MLTRSAPNGASSGEGRPQCKRRVAVLVTLAVAAFVGACCILLLPPKAGSPADARNLQPSDNPADTTSSSTTVPALTAPARLFQTAANTNDRITPKNDVPFVADFTFSGPMVDVLNQQGQTLMGFGGGFTEASATVYKQLSAENKQRVLQDYFGKDGIGYTLGRVSINSCDFSVASYSFDDVNNDFTLQHFDDNLTHETSTLLPFLQDINAAATAAGLPLQLLATPWSPPAWMKTNGQMDRSNMPCLRADALDSWARYISRWISAYKAKGLPVRAMTVQNEPENDAVWEACTMTAQDEGSFLSNHLGPILRKDHPEVKIFVFDHNKDHVAVWGDSLLSNGAVTPFVDGVAFHWYSGDQFENVKQLQTQFPQKTLLATEATYERYRWHAGTSLATGDWTFGMGYAHDIIGDLNAGSVGWIDWNILLDQNGGPNHVGNVCDAAIMADLPSGQVYHHPQFYFIGHFSKFMPPGAKHLQTVVSNTPSYHGGTRPYGTCTADDGLEATSVLRPDGVIATTVLNCGNTQIDFKLRHGSSAAHATIPPQSVQTYLFGSTGSAVERTVVVG